MPIFAALDRVVVAAPSGFALSRAGARRALAGLALAAIVVVPVALSYERISGSPAPTTLAAKSEGPRGWLPEARHLQKILGFLYSSQPLPVLLAAGGALAMATLSVIPSFILFFALQKYFVQGIATTGIKG